MKKLKQQIFGIHVIEYLVFKVFGYKELTI